MIASPPPTSDPIHLVASMKQARPAFAVTGQATMPGGAAIPRVRVVNVSSGTSARSAPPYTRHRPSASHVPGTAARRITVPAPYAAAQRRITVPAPGADQHKRSAQQHTGQFQKRTPDSRQPPQQAKAGNEGWEQPILTIVVIPILTNLVSSALYERLRKSLHRGQRTTFQFQIIRDNGSIVDARLETDDCEALRHAIGALQRLANPVQLYEWDDVAWDWNPLLD
jgi:hypothetical protein